MKKLLDLIHSPYTDDFSTRSREAIEELFGSPDGRYPDRAKQDPARIDLVLPGNVKNFFRSI